MTATAQFQVINPLQLARARGPGSPTCWHEGDVWSRRTEPAGFGQFVSYIDAAAGSRIGWTGAHGDEALFVLDGTVEIGGTSISRKGAAVVESGASGDVRALVDSHLLHVGATSAGSNVDSIIGPPRPDDHCVHVYGPDGTASFAHEGDGRRSHTVWYTDSFCESCRVSLFRVLGDEQIPKPLSHSHTAHELITVIDGELRFGAQTAPALSTVAIAAGRKYGFSTNPGRWEFVNFRLDASYIDFGSRRPRVLESIESFERLA